MIIGNKFSGYSADGRRLLYRGGGGGGSSTTVVNQTATPTLTQEQKDYLQAQTNFYTGTIQPTYQNAVTGATNIYNQTAGGVNAAAQNYGGVAGQAQEALGSTGESALRTGISGLQALYDPAYQEQQMQAALAPAQAQYRQNIADQGAQFGGAGQIGSARQALAAQQLAGQSSAIQQQTAAQVMNNIARQRQEAGTALARLGQEGLTGSQAAAANQVTASMTPQQLYNQYASVIFGTPGGSYSPNFAGTQGMNTSSTTSGRTSNWNAGFDLSDRRAKTDVTFVGKRGEHKVYTFKYIGSDTLYEGVMAQDLLEYMPEAVIVGDDGLYRVDYNRVGFTMKELA